MNTAEQLIEFDRIKEQLAEFSCTQKGKQAAMQLKPYLSETEVRTGQRETSEARAMFEKCGNPPVTALEGIEEWIGAAQRGECLSPWQLEQIRAILNAVGRMKDYLNHCKQYQISLAYYEENLDSMEELRLEISEKIRGERVDDFASRLLKTLREEIDAADAKMHEKADAAIRANKACMSDSFSTIRSGHLCIPVKKEYKYKIKGAVIDKSATGNTMFIEPLAVSKCYEKLQELKIEEENEERRILYTLSAMLSDKEELFLKNSRTIEKLDFIFAKARLSLEYDGVEPLFNTLRYIRLKGGRHPLMDKKTSVPLDFEIGNKINGIVITGPNTGGKTVALKTVMINCMMAQSGLHVPCEKAEICMNDAFLCDIGDGQNLSENLSTFSAHITNVLSILRRADRESLVVMDELGSGTDPAEGMGIAIAVLEELKKSGALFLVTTHYPEVKEYTKKEEHIVNARMTFDKETLRPLYRLVIGEAGESCAFYIAGKLGMPKDMLRRAAYEAYGNEPAVDVDRLAEKERLEKTSHEKIKRKKDISRQ
ncbi:MAG TPA: DNA mismatch repair protein MutS, partial [Lachnospiraceae bacterium]|nr:DNA mismatch repair protein MutS [Lachnospiraceae bacterium]